MRKSLLVLIVSTVLAVAGGIGVASRSTPQPSGAAAPDVRIDPGDGRDLTQVVADLQASLRRVPDDHVTWANLALAYVEQVRVSGDTTLYEKAEDAVDHSLAIEPDDNVAALAATSALHAVKHEFGDALDYADEALSIDPYHPAALALRIDALTELGRYREQMRALRVADRRQPGVPVVARYAYAWELRGEVTRAIALLRRSAASATGGDRTHLLTLRADLERRRGRTAVAASLLTTVRRLDPDYLPALISRARLAAAEGRTSRSARLWLRIVTLADHPEHRVELGETYLALGRDRLAQEQFATLFDYAASKDAVALGRELDVALFMSDHGDPAVGLAAARAEWRSRKGVPAADALGWTLHQVGRDARALHLARLATRLGTPDPHFWIHRGLIEASLGRDSQARQHLTYGLEIGGGMSVWQVRRAEHVLAGLG